MVVIPTQDGGAFVFLCDKRDGAAKRPSLHFVRLFHVYLLAHSVEELILEIGETLIGHHLDAQTILHLPFSLDAHQTLIDISRHEGVHMEADFANVEFGCYKSDFAFESVDKE